MVWLGVRARQARAGVSASEHSAQALEFTERWRDQDPALRLAEVYAEDHGWVIASALYFELAECLFRIDQAHVREAKLGWWVEEVSHYAAGGPRHPLSRALRQLGVGAQTLRELVLAAATLLDAAAAESQDHLQQQRQPLLHALGELLLCGRTDAAELARGEALLAACARMDDCFRVVSLGRQGTQALPILSLAEHARLGLSRDQLGQLSEAELIPLRRQLCAHWRPLHPLALPPMGVYLRLWSSALRGRGQPPRLGAASALRAWHAARQWR